MSNEKIQQEIFKFIAEEELDARNITSYAHSVTMNNFCLTPITPNTQGDNKNAILTSERLNNSNAQEEMLKGLKINDIGYYESDENDARVDPARDQKVPTHTSDGKKRKVTDTSNGSLQQKLSSNRTLPIITTTIDPHIPGRFATCVGNPHALTTPTTKGVITDADYWACKQDGQVRHHAMRWRCCGNPPMG